MHRRDKQRKVCWWSDAKEEVQKEAVGGERYGGGGAYESQATKDVLKEKKKRYVKDRGEIR